MKPVTLFMWGYWGWGSSTAQLVEAFDAAERARGFEPLLFVDARWSRSVRAAGFRDCMFENRVGASRYRWMRSLGNRAIGSANGPRVQIADPTAAGDLGELAAKAAANNQRLLFFSACERPCVDGQPNCHREDVARLLLKDAKQKGVALEVVEWPGGDPVRFEIPVSSKLLRDVLRGRTTVPIGKGIPLHEAAAVPHCSVARLVAPDAAIHAIVGPAVYRREWQIPIQGLPVEADDTVEHLEREARRLRHEWGYEPRRA